ncbi:MAG: cobalt-precorrin 5A hydrolase [Deltaproteobacteria bacterium]|nr:cobalt-precorrin 5A hydrolase [Deltaproteobacteria bacterium]
MFNNLAIFALTKNSIKLGKSLSQEANNIFLFANPMDFKVSVRKAFKKFDGLIFIMAAGIVVRTIAPLLKGKEKDPAVVVMDEKGRYVISLLSGHLGRANALAKMIAKIISAEPVITTATDVNNLPCIEDIAERFNLVIEDVKKIKVINSAIVNGRKTAFVDNNAKRLKTIKRFVGSRVQRFKFCKSVAQAQKFKADGNIIITHHSSPITQNCFLLCPKDLVVGIGCDRGVKMKEVERAYFSVLKKWDMSPLSVRNLTSIDVKQNEKGLLQFAKKYNLNIEFYSKTELAKMSLPSGFSRFVMSKVGVGGVCEPAALKSAGVKKLLVKKQKIGRVTIAVAEAPFKSH